MRTAEMMKSFYMLNLKVMWHEPRIDMMVTSLFVVLNLMRLACLQLEQVE